MVGTITKVIGMDMPGILIGRFMNHGVRKAGSNRGMKVSSAGGGLRAGCGFYMPNLFIHIPTLLPIQRQVCLLGGFQRILQLVRRHRRSSFCIFALLLMAITRMFLRALVDGSLYPLPHPSLLPLDDKKVIKNAAIFRYRIHQSGC